MLGVIKFLNQVETLVPLAGGYWLMLVTEFVYIMNRKVVYMGQHILALLAIFAIMLLIDAFWKAMARRVQLAETGEIIIWRTLRYYLPRIALLPVGAACWLLNIVWLNIAMVACTIIAIVTLVATIFLWAITGATKVAKAISATELDATAELATASSTT